MKIAIINITGGGISGGYKKYLQNIIPRMAVSPGIETILCASPKTIKIENWLSPFSKIKLIDCQPFRFLRGGFDSKLKQHLDDFAPDLIFIPIERFLEFKKVPVINMVQNMEPLVGSWGGPLSERFKNWIRKKEGRSALKKSNRIIVPSAYVRDFLVKHWDIPDEKIGLVYHGVDSPEKDISSPQSFSKQWDNGFLFTAGSIRPARGLEDILYAFKYLQSKLSSSPVLLIAGEASPGMERYQKGLKDWTKKNGLSSQVYWTGGLTAKEMSWCYKKCQAFIVTSRVESFGLIAAEAMAHGSICISSDSSCLPEIFDGAAVFYPVGKPDVLAQKIKEVLGWSLEKKEKMSQLSLKRASFFSWDKCAQQTLEEFKKVIN